MRTVILIALLASATSLQSQILFPGSFMDSRYMGGLNNNFHLDDSASARKWSFTKYSALSTSMAFFKGGNAMIFAAPIGLQLNRRLTDNLSAFANVSLIPAYVSFNSTFIANDFNKTNQNNTSFRSGSAGMYSRAALGLQYTNDDKTFSISGSIGIERNVYPGFQSVPTNNTRPNQVISTNRRP